MKYTMKRSHAGICYDVDHMDSSFVVSAIVVIHMFYTSEVEGKYE